jgi:nucleoside-diphosphate-sugar epimerase
VGRKALVAGALGIVGGSIADHLHARGGWEVVGVSRGAPRRETGWRLVRADLTDADAVRALVAAEGGITHLFHAARAPRPDPTEETRMNAGMLDALLAPLAASPDFEHVCMVHGSKWYGSHLGPFRTPAREDDPRPAGPNFYYDQADRVAERQAGARWTWSTLRPGVVWGYALGYPHNIAAVIAVLASLARARGEPLYFPGTQACYDAITQATDARLLARAAEWAATDPRCANQHFNLLDGDAFRWRYLWPVIARHLGLEAGGVRTVRLAETMADRAPQWRTLVEHHSLRPHALGELVDWHYADMTFRQDWDHLSSTLKARAHGFDGFVDTEAMVLALLDRYRAERLVP